jgi:hypothetical protein
MHSYQMAATVTEVDPPNGIGKHRCRDRFQKRAADLSEIAGSWRVTGQVDHYRRQFRYRRRANSGLDIDIIKPESLHCRHFRNRAETGRAAIRRVYFASQIDNPAGRR